MLQASSCLPFWGEMSQSFPANDEGSIGMASYSLSKLNSCITTSNSLIILFRTHCLGGLWKFVRTLCYRQSIPLGCGLDWQDNILCTIRVHAESVLSIQDACSLCCNRHPACPFRGGISRSFSANDEESIGISF